MTLRDFLFTVLGGLIVWVLQQLYLNRRERLKEKESKLVKHLNAERTLPKNILNELGPGNSMTMVREMLGSPVRYDKRDVSVFLDKEVKTNSYLYTFKNAYIKITSKDNESVDSITVQPLDKSIWMPDFCPFEEGNTNNSGNIGEVKVADKIMDGTRHSFITSRWDASFALQYYTGSPLYLEHTYFGFAIEKREEYFEKNDPRVFNGEVVDTVCVSADPDNSFYIYFSEVR